MSSKLRILSSDAKDTASCSKVPAVSLSTANDSAVKGREFRGRAALVTLGCAKNHVDSEVMLGVLQQHGYELTNDLSRADVAVVNTCGFLQSSVKESIDAILSVAEYKKKGRLRRLIVAGCLVERYRDGLKQSLPEADAFILIDDITKVAAAADSELHSTLSDVARPYFLYDDQTPRSLGETRHTAYVKISEGCDRPCSFCIIPQLRGKMRSRTSESIVREVQNLAALGVREVSLVAQDSTDYGRDLRVGGSSQLNVARLLRELDAARAVDWIRLLYAYPVGLDSDLLSTIVDLPTVCKYVDVPLQHSSEAVLREMKRPLGKYSPRRLVEMMRRDFPQIAIRTTFIVGFPGETEQDIDDLEEFVAAGHFSSLGVFTYSAEEGTPAAELPGAIPERVKKNRRQRIMLAQQKVMRERNRQLVGTSFEVLVDGAHHETELLLVGRTAFQAPEVDGQCVINEVLPDSAGNLHEIGAGILGTFEVIDSMGYDLLGRFQPYQEQRALAKMQAKTRPVEVTQGAALQG
jgi:ribosomal protein S12 methylthiotransferase